MNDWWLKFYRAEKHMVDINQEAMRYAESHPYNFERIRLPDSKNAIRGRFHITKQPDPVITVMFGDFIHNLRSALDYVVVACVPKQRRKHAGFPILFENIFAKDENGDFVVKDAELRQNFDTATDGLHPEARAFIIGLQPYHQGANAHRNILGIINRLENADKHRQLTMIGGGGREFTAYFSLCGSIEFKYGEILAKGRDFLKDNTEIRYSLPVDGIPHPEGALVKPCEMDMHLIGTAKVLVKVTRVRGNQPADVFPIDSIMDMALSDVKQILTRLECFVRSD